jgi:hypothetical protein
MYVTVFDKNNRAVSSSTIKKEGIDPQRKSVLLWNNKSLWDQEHGASAWRQLLGETNTRIISEKEGTIKIGSAEGEKFIAITNSVLLGRTEIKNYQGIELEVTGNGSPGKLKLSLVKNSCSTEEVKWETVIEYAAGVSIHKMIWDDFESNNPGNKELLSVDGLMLEGKRQDGSLITINNIKLF